MTTISTANQNDIAGILAVQEALLTNPDQLIPDNGKNGFLIHNTPAAELDALVSNPETGFVLVAKDDDKVSGYAIVYRTPEWIRLHPGWRDALAGVNSIDAHSTDEVIEHSFYLQHIARAPGNGKAGVRLFTSVMREIRLRSGNWLIGDILVSPVVNERSIRFHEAKGAMRICVYAEDDRLEWAVYVLRTT